MIAHIEGELATKNPAYVVVHTSGGVGYHLHISLSTYEKISALSHVRLLAHQVIKDDGHDLYGFFEEEERVIFRKLISVSGIGPGTARMILSCLPPNDLRQAIIQGNVSLITSVKGVGAKTAQRLVVELQDAMAKTGGGSPAAPVHLAGRNTEEAALALVALGFSRASADKAVLEVAKGNGVETSAEEIIKKALRIL